MSTSRILLAMAVLAVASAARADWLLRARITCPGASASEMTERVMLPAERVARNVTGVKQIDSVLRPEVLTMTMCMAGDGQDRRAVRLDVLNMLQSNVKHMSVDVEKIEVDDIYEHVYPRIVAIHGKGTDMRTLKRRAKWMISEIQSCPNVQSVKMLGAEDYVLALMIPKWHMGLHYELPGLTQMLEGYLSQLAAGSINVGGRRLRIHAEDVLTKHEDISDMPFIIYPTTDSKGETIMLRDHLKMDIQRSNVPPDSMAGLDGERCIFLAVSFFEGMSDPELDKVIANAKAEMPYGLEVDSVYDGAEYGKDRALVFDLSMVEGVSIEMTDEQLRGIATAVRALPGVDRVLTVAGAADIATASGQKINVPAPNTGILIVELAKRTSQDEICRQIHEVAAEKSPAAIVLPRMRVKNDGYGVCHSETITSRYDGCAVQHRVEKMVAAARATPGVNLAYSDWGDPVEYLRFNLYKSRARQLCVTPSGVSIACRKILEGYPIASDFWYRGERLPIVLRLGTNDGNVDVQKLATAWVFSDALNKYVPFGQVVSDFKPCSEIGCIVHKNGLFAATIYVWADSDEAIDAVKKAWADIK